MLESLCIIDFIKGGENWLEREEVSTKGALLPFIKSTQNLLNHRKFKLLDN